MSQKKSPHQLGLTLRHCVLEAEAGHPDLARISQLIQDGAELNCIYSDGYGDIDYRTPLYIAAQNNYYAVAVILINAGANLEASGTFIGTPLSIAAANGHLDMVKLLIEKGADLEYQNYAVSILMEASLYGKTDVVKCLLENGANPFYRNSRGQSAHSMCRKKYPDTALVIKESMREKRFEYTPGLKDRVFQRVANRAITVKKPMTVKKLKPR